MVILLVCFLTTFAICAGCFLVLVRFGEREDLLGARFKALALTRQGVGSMGGSAPDALLKQAERLPSPFLRFVNLQERLRPLLRQAGATLSVRRFLLWSAALAFGALLLLLLVSRSAVIALLAASFAGSLPYLIMSWQRKRRLRWFGEKLPEVVDTINRSIRAGHSLVAALGIVAEQAPEPWRAEFAEVFRQQHFGMPLRHAVLQMLERVPSQDLRVLVTAMLVQKDTGGNLSQILDRTSTVIRDRLKLQGDIRVHTAQGRFTGWILCLLPLVMLLLINVINPGYSKPLTDNPFGRKILLAGIGLLALGAWLIRRIVNGIEI